MKSLLESAKKKWARGRFERSLANVIEQANAHKRKNVQPGNRVYKILWEKADKQVTSFCTKWKVPRFEIEAEVPQLAVVYGLTHPQPSGAVKFIIGALIAGAFAIIAIGVGSGLIAAIHNAVVQHLHF